MQAAADIQGQQIQTETQIMKDKQMIDSARKIAESRNPNLARLPKVKKMSLFNRSKELEAQVDSETKEKCASCATHKDFNDGGLAKCQTSNPFKTKKCGCRPYEEWINGQQCFSVDELKALDNDLKEPKETVQPVPVSEPSDMEPTTVPSTPSPPPAVVEPASSTSDAPSSPPAPVELSSTVGGRKRRNNRAKKTRTRKTRARKTRTRKTRTMKKRNRNNRRQRNMKKRTTRRQRK